MSEMQREESANLDLDFEKRGGLLPVVVQAAGDGDVLMVAWANREAVAETMRSRMATFWSTSRNELWKKGETSGDFLAIEEVLVDCDQDTLLYRVTLKGAGACHTSDPATGVARRSCFYRKIDLDTGGLVTL